MKTAVLVALLLLAVGCTQEGATESPGTPTARPTRTATLTPTTQPPTLPRTTLAPLTTTQAAKVFATAVRPRNAALAKFDADLKAAAPVETLRQDAIALLTAERQFLAILDKFAWPASVRESVESLATCISTSILWYEASTRIKQASDVQLPPACGRSDAQLIRLRLELPSY